MNEQVEGQVAVSDQYAEWREVPAVGDMTDDLIAEEEHLESQERGLITAIPEPRADHHIVTGMAALARMSAQDFESTITTVTTGMDRLKEFMRRAMVKGEDYGEIKGIAKPFLHLPGAEKLGLLYGLAVRQEAERIDGKRKVLIENGTEIVTDEWETPPLSYHVRSYVHVGSLDGPVVAMGYGEANSWEEKYRYRNAKPTCPNCGRPDLVLRKSPPQMAGKWQCPSWGGKDGCNATFEGNDPRIAAGGKVENEDPYSLAETLIQMASKRSFVASMRRATGTSGLFTQDEDSPSVAQQSSESGAPEPDDIPIEPVDVKVEVGGKAVAPTPTQIAMLGNLSKAKDLGPDVIVSVMQRIEVPFPTLPDGGDRGAKGRALLAFIESGAITADQFGKLLHTIDTGEVEAPQEVA